MKRCIAILMVLLPLFVAGQNREQILQQIENAQSFEEMPFIKVVAVRDANRIGRKLEGYNTLQQVTKGDTLIMFFPIHIYDSGNWTRADESYNYIVLEPEMNKESLVVHQNIILHLDKEDNNLFRKWTFKYQELGKILQQKML